MDRLVLALATGFGAGYVPYAPGTVGSLWGVLMMWGWQRAGLLGWWNGALLAGLLLIGVPLCERAARILAVNDPGAVVFDEIAAFPVVFAVVPLSPVSAAAGFVWFRLFDILKPWPIRWFDRLPGGWGIMADDLAAGLAAAIALWATMKLW